MVEGEKELPEGVEEGAEGVAEVVVDAARPTNRKVVMPGQITPLKAWLGRQIVRRPIWGMWVGPRFRFR